MQKTKCTQIPLLLSLMFSLVLSYSDNDRFSEELMLKPLLNGNVYAYFQFTTLYDASINNLNHSHFFPRSLGEILNRHSINELHISLTKGLWKYESYGYPFYDAAPGAEIYAWFNNNVINIDKNWEGLTNALSGLLCASFNFVDSSNSLSPKFTFRPTGIIKELINSSYLRYSSLPRETVCTENLTPFKKLLPCDARKGLATLLNSAFIHNTNYHSLGIHFRSVCGNLECTNQLLELKQSVSLIYDTVSLDFQAWSLRKLFGSGLRNACPLSIFSNVYVDLSYNGTLYNFQSTPEPNKIVTSIRGGQHNKFGIFNVHNKTNEGILSFSINNFFFTNTEISYPVILHVNRYIIGYGQERGSLVTKLYNNHWKSINVVLLENVPWYLPLYLHSIKIFCNKKEINPLMQRYIPGKERKQPYYLELILKLPPHSITKLSIEIDYMFLKWQEYPPDANHGFYMGPAVITAYLPIARNYTSLPQDGSTIYSVFNASRDGYLLQLRTETILISLPTPDFSMPYNVICLACTAVALAFGPLHNISTKRLVLKRVEDKGLKGKFKSILILFKKVFGVKEKTA